MTVAEPIFWVNSTICGAAQVRCRKTWALA